MYLRLTQHPVAIVATETQTMYKTGSVLRIKQHPTAIVVTETQQCTRQVM